MSGVFINSDAWNFWLDFPGIMDDPAKAIRDDVDFYSDGGGVEAVFYNMNFSRSFLNTKVGTPIWKDCTFDDEGNLYLRGFRLGKEETQAYGALVKRTKFMHETMPDFMQYRYDYCHKKGIEMWVSMRMNDVHHTGLGEEFRPQHSDLWLDHKEMLRAWYRHTWRAYWIDKGMDYGRRDVYEYHLALAREYLLDYESDGIELDWMRAAPVFKPGYDEYNTEVMTRFIRDVKSAALEAEEKWGHRVRIAVRVPYHPQEAYMLGMDVNTWAVEGLIDVLIPSPTNLCMEQDIHLKLWRAIAPKPVILAPCIDYIVVPNREIFTRQSFTNEIDYGMASNYYSQGADTIYFYNHFPRHERDTEPRIREIFPTVADREKVASMPRRHVVTTHEGSVEGIYKSPCFPPFIWEKCSDGGVRLNAGEKTAGRKGVILIGSTVPLNINLLVNTEYCKPVEKFELPPNFREGGNGMIYGSFGVAGGKDKIYWTCMAVPAQALHDGWNNVEIYNHDPHTIESKEILWMELILD